MFVWFRFSIPASSSQNAVTEACKKRKEKATSFLRPPCEISANSLRLDFISLVKSLLHFAGSYWKSNMPKATSWWIETQLYSPGNLWDQHLGAKPLRKSLESDLGKTHGCMECPVLGKCGKVVRSSKCPAGGIQGQPDHQRHVQWNHKLWTNIDMHRLYRWILSEKATRNMKEWDLLVPNSAFPHILTYILDPMSLVPFPCQSLWAKPTPLRTWRPSSLRLCELETFQETLCEFSVNQLKKEWVKETDFGPMILSKEISLQDHSDFVHQKPTHALL